MDNKINTEDPEILKALGPFAPVPVYHAMDVQRAVCALTMAYLDEPIDREAVVHELAPFLVRALQRGTVKRRAKTKILPTHKEQIMWAQDLIRKALAVRMSQTA